MSAIPLPAPAPSRADDRTLFGSVSLDLDRLVASGALSLEHARELSTLGALKGPNDALVSSLYILGALAVASGVLLLEPSLTTGLVLALVALGGGAAIRLTGRKDLDVLALGLAISGALGLAGWFSLEYGGQLSSTAILGGATGIVAAVALGFRSLFLVALVPLGIGAMLGSGTSYWHASYYVFVEEALLTAGLFTALAAGLWAAARRMAAFADASWSAMAHVAARVSFVLANFGLWVGSLWGDRVGEHVWGPGRYYGSTHADYAAFAAERTEWLESALVIHEHVFAIGWAGFALAAIVLGRRFGLRFLSNGGVVFLAINAYTQFFETFQAEAWALVIGGATLVAAAIALVRWDFTPRRRIAA